MAEQQESALHVARHEFNEFKSEVKTGFSTLGSQIDRLMQARQVNWMFILAVIVACGGALGFGMKTVGEVSSLRESIASLRDSVAMMTDTDDGLRERTRALESQTRGTTTEQETQHKWMSDVHNLDTQLSEIMQGARCEMDPAHPVHFPARTYWPFSGIGHANGSKL